MGLTAAMCCFEGRLPKTETRIVVGHGARYLLSRGLRSLQRGVTPGFDDVQFKVAVRPTERTRLTLFGLAGRETLRQIESEPNGGEEVPP